MMDFTEITAHSGPIWGLFGLGWTMFLGLAWRTLGRIERKLDGQQESQAACQATLPKDYVSKADFETEKKEVWEAINHHGHKDDRVTR